MAFFAVIAVFVVLFVTGELIAKWYPYALKIGDLVRFPSWTSSSILASTNNSSPAFSIGSGLEFLRTYFSAIWIALVAGIAIASGIDVLIPKSWLRRLLRSGESKKGVLVGGLLSLPCMMCTCCSAPMARSLVKNGINKSSAVAFWIGNPVLNPAVIAFLAFVGPWQWVALRVVFGLLLVFGVGIVVAKFGKEHEVQRISTGTDGTWSEVPQSLGNGIKRYLRSFSRFSLSLIPEYVVIVFLLGALRGWIFPLIHDSSSVGVASIIVVAVLGTMMVIPTAGELPIVLSLAGLGASPIIIGCLLLTLPAISLPSMAMVGRGFGWFTILSTALCVAIVGIAGGLALALL